jgi:DNA-binding transcriptional LysR family regulator
VSGSITWDDQRIFLAVLQTGSLSAAARTLGLTQPTVRARLEALEKALGTALFTRSAKGLVPTEQARALGEPALAMARASEAFVRAGQARAGEVAGTVRLSVSEMVGVEVLPPMLSQLRAQRPGILVEVVLSNTSADVLAQEVDIAVRMHSRHHHGLVAQKVGAIPLALFAHADYLARRGEPKTIDELAEHDFIGPDRSRADLELATRVLPSLERARFVVRTDSHPAQVAAARAGLGIAATQKAIGYADPVLRPVLPELTVGAIETWLVTAESLIQVPRIRYVFDHLVRSFKDYVRRYPAHRNER